MGEEGIVSGGVFDHGTHEEDGPGTWEALVSPREQPVMRRAGDPSPTILEADIVSLFDSLDRTKLKEMRGWVRMRGG